MTGRDLFFVLLFFILWRVGLFLVGGLAAKILPFHPSYPYWQLMQPLYHLPRWISSWAGFDGVHYMTIAKSGYIGTGLIQAFFPLFPFVLLHTLYLFVGPQMNILLVGLFLSNIFALYLAIFWFLFIKETVSTKIAWISLFFLFLFPTSFFFGAYYTEPLFLLLVTLTFYAAHRKKWWFAGIFAGLAAMTRVVGIVLFPALVIEMWQSTAGMYLTLHHIKTFVQKNILLFFWFVVCCAGLGAFMLFLNHEFHDPFYFLHVQAAFGAGRQSSFVLYPQVVWRSLRILLTAQTDIFRYYSYVQEFLFGTLGLIAILFSLRFAKFSHAFFSLIVFLIPPLTGSFSSMPRYTLASFSIFFLLAHAVKNTRWLQFVYLFIFSIFLLINTVLFIQGYWVA